MDSVTYAVHKAITKADAQQRADATSVNSSVGAVPGDHNAGLQPFANRTEAHSAYADAKGSDLYIILTRSEETFALYMEMTAAGLAPPVGLVEDGAEVILSQGGVDVYVTVDEGAGVWWASLQAGKDGRRMEWKAEVI